MTPDFFGISHIHSTTNCNINRYSSNRGVDWGLLKQKSVGKTWTLTNCDRKLKIILNDDIIPPGKQSDQNAPAWDLKVDKAD